MVKCVRLVGALVACVAMSGGDGTRAADAPGRRGAELVFRVLGTGRGWATNQIGGISQGELKEGESEHWHIQIRTLAPGGGSACGGSNVVLGSEAPSFEGPDAPYLVWEVQGTVRRAETDQIEVEYAWERRTRAGGAHKPASGRDSLTLREDSRVLLDFAPIPAGEFPDSCHQNVALELVASIPEEPMLAERRIAYDLWLVSEDRGKSTSRRLRLIGKQGGKVDFDYGTLRSELKGLPVLEAGGEVIETVVKGHVRGRLQADGTIEVALLAERGVRPSHHHWWSGAMGEKVVLAAAGETLRLELPPPSGLPESVKDAGATLNALAEHQISLVLTATPME